MTVTVEISGTWPYLKVPTRSMPGPSPSLDHIWRVWSEEPKIWLFARLSAVQLTSRIGNVARADIGIGSLCESRAGFARQVDRMLERIKS